MDAVIGALVAAIIGWLSILLVVTMPAPKLGIDRTAVQRAGGAAIATIAISVMGVQLPSWSSLAVFAVVLLAHVAVPSRRATT